jgi:hypothetical protein
MARDLSGLKWPDLPFHGAVGAGRQDEASPVPEGFSLTPSADAEPEPALQEVPDGSS